MSNVAAQGDLMVCNDLDSGYWHVPMCKDHWQYVGIHFVEEDGNVIFWTWRLLVLGLHDAAHVFTRLLAPLMAQLRKEGIRCLIYINNFLLTAASKQLALEQEKRVFELFCKCGWIFKPAKRSGEPSQVCKFLGLEVDSRDMTFNIPACKLEKIKSRLELVKARRTCRVRELAREVGTLQSVHLPTGPIVTVMTQSLYVAITKAASWSSFVAMDEMARYKVRWWLDQIGSLTMYPIEGSLSTTPVRYEVASKASGVGHFCYLVSDGKMKLTLRPCSTFSQSLETLTWTRSHPPATARARGSSRGSTYRVPRV